MLVKQIQEMRCPLFRGILPKLMVICLVMVLSVFLCEQVDAKKKRKRFISPVKVEEVATFPDPFIIGQSPLTFSMMVKVPLFAIDDKVLVVSALITSPTRRSMSFVSQRLRLAEATQSGLLGLVPVEFVWDGKNQHDQLVKDGSYFYEIQAKLMEDKGEGLRTKIVSHRIQGTLEALAYAGEVLPPIPPEPEVPEEIESLQQEELLADDLPMMEEELKAENEAPGPGENLLGDVVDQSLELSGENESGQELLKGDLGDIVSDNQGEALLEEADSTEPSSLELEALLPGVGQPLESTTEQPLIPLPAEPASSSDANPSLH